MVKKAQKILFSIFFLIFLFSAPVLILHSQGYRLDWENKKITQTGGLFLRILPKKSSVYLNRELIQKTDFFFGSILIENLLPKRYHIKVHKEEYFPWEKELEIKEKEVTEAKNILLFPKNPNFIPLVKGVQDFWFSPNKRKIILREKEGENLWALKLYDLDKNVKSQLIGEGDVFTSTDSTSSPQTDPKQIKRRAEFFSLEFLNNGNEILLEIGIGEQIKYFTLNINATFPILEEVKKPLPLLENIVTQKILNGDVYYLDNWGHLYKTNPSSLLKEKITIIPFPIQQETDYELDIFSEFIFLKEGKNLYLLNQTDGLFEKFFDNIVSLKLSPDKKKLVYFSKNEIHVLFLKEQKSQPRRIIGEKIFLIRLSEKITDVFWMNSDYLVFSTENAIKIIETDTRDKVNIINLGEFMDPEIFWNLVDKKLYLLSKENLLISQKLIP